MESLEISNGELSNVLIHSTLKTVEVLLTYFQERYNPSDSFQGIIRVNLIRYFMPAFSKKWKQSFSGKEKRVEMFLNQNKTWLEECSDKTKKRRMDSIKQSISGDIVDSFSNVDNKAAIEIIKKGILNETMNVESAIESEKAIPFTNDEALALFVDLKLTKHKYKLLRNLLKKKNADILPSYEEVSNAKTNCYPPSTAIQITETGATIRLQGLLDHTAARLLKHSKMIKVCLNNCF